MLHHLGATRSSFKPDHLLQTPDTFIRTPLPDGHKVDFVVHVGSRIGANFTQMTAEFTGAGSRIVGAPRGTERFIYMLEGSLDVHFFNRADSDDFELVPGGFAYIPPAIQHSLTSRGVAKAVLIEKVYQDYERTLVGVNELKVVGGRESDITSTALGGDPDLQVRALMPDGPLWDFAVNTMTYAPGASLSMIEIHVMEHGLLMLEGGGIYRLGDHWYPVTAGDFIWMAPYCPQWFGALGKVPAKYLIYKDFNRHPLDQSLKMSRHDIRPFAGPNAG
jgi:(S)-ureidoglycine aminohydrolase